MQETLQWTLLEQLNGWALRKYGLFTVVPAKKCRLRLEEIENAEEEGILFSLLTNPVEMIGDESNTVKVLRCQRMTLGEPDQSGRRNPVPVPNEYIDLSADTVIVAIGQRAKSCIITGY